MFQGNKAGAVNDHTAIVKKPLAITKTSHNNTSNVPREHRESSSGGGAGGVERDNREHRERERERPGPRDVNSGQKFSHNAGQLKRSPSFSPSVTTGNSHHVQHGPPPPKKHKVATSVRDVTIAEAAKYGSLNDYAFFDKVSFSPFFSLHFFPPFLCFFFFFIEILAERVIINVGFFFPLGAKSVEVAGSLREFSTMFGTFQSGNSFEERTYTIGDSVPRALSRIIALVQRLFGAFARARVSRFNDQRPRQPQYRGLTEQCRSQPSGSTARRSRDGNRLYNVQKTRCLLLRVTQILYAT